MLLSDEEIKEWIKRIENINPLFQDINTQIQGFLAAGGQGIVFYGLYKEIQAAIKIYYPGQNLERIEREVSALQQIECQEIVKLLWYGKVNVSNIDLPVVITELIIGSPLSEVLKSGSLAEKRVSDIVIDTSKAIKEIWDKHKIVHRDIKPSNILIRPNGRACIIDLGVARHIEKSTLTATGYTWGTHGYFSPEQEKGVKQLTCKSDVYALAIVTLECALGHHPTNRNQQQLFTSSFHQTLPIPINHWRMESLIRRMFDPKPNIRPLPSEIIDELLA